MYSIDHVIETDPTLRKFLRENEFDSDKFDHQIDVMCSAIKVALGHWLDLNYPTKQTQNNRLIL